MKSLEKRRSGKTEIALQFIYINFIVNAERGNIYKSEYGREGLVSFCCQVCRLWLVCSLLPADSWSICLVSCNPGLAGKKEIFGVARDVEQVGGLKV